MKVGIDYTAGVYGSSGVGRYARGLVHALAVLDRENEYTLLWAPTPAPEGRELPHLDRAATFPANFRARRLPLTGRLLTAGWHRLRLPLPIEAFSGPLDVLHGPDFVVPPARRARRAVTVHDLTFLAVPQYAHPPLRAYLERAVPRNVRTVDHVFANSEATKRDLQRLLDVPEHKITVAYAGADPRFRPMGEAEREGARGALARVGVPTGPYLLTVGVLEPRKNHIGLLRAFAELRRRGAPHRLVIAGRRGWRYEPIFAAVETLHLGAVVTFLDHFSDDLLPALYACAEVFLFPSFYEGFGIPVLEAMGCGTPAIVGDRSSLPEVTGGAAVLANPDDDTALAEAAWSLLHDPATQATLRDRGVARARAFDWQVSARQVLARYHMLGA